MWWTISFTVLLSLLPSVRPSVHIPSLHFSYTLDEVHQQFEGHVYDGVPRGSHVPLLEAQASVEGDATPVEGYLEKHIRLVITHNGNTVLPRTRGESPTPPDVAVEGSEAFPEGFEFAVVHSDAFDVDDNFFLVVSEPGALKDRTEVLFYVTLVTLPNNSVVANPLPFMVHVEHKLPSQNKQGAAIYAGVIVLLICAIAFLIPFTVRAKRRKRAGKPICACGSYSSQDSESLSSPKRGEDNHAVVVDELHAQGKERATIQEHMMRSVSEMRFQPKWLDPHYKEDHHAQMQKPFSDTIKAASSPPPLRAAKRENTEEQLSVKL